MSHEDTIVVGAGCFWGVEDLLRLQEGVVSTCVGYAGGDVVNPTYEQVCSGTTGHAEVVKVRFDSSVTTLETILRFFWTHHIATGRNLERYQYRSIVACRATQEPVVLAVRSELESSVTNGEAITTQVVVDAPFYEAEEYHQQYYEKGREMVREVRRQCGLPPTP